MTQPSEPRRGADRPKLLVRVRRAIRLRNYSPRTEKADVGWIKRFIYFHGKRHPAEMGGIVVRDGKGRKDRVTMLPVRLVPCLQSHLERVRLQHEKDLAEGAGSVWLPYALERKYPNAPWEWAWQWVFPAIRFYVDRQSGRRRRHHLHQTVLQRAVKDGARRAGITKPVTCHTLRHAFATELLLRGGYDPRTVQELLGHRDLSTTMVYLHVLNKGGRGVQSPLDQED